MPRDVILFSSITCLLKFKGKKLYFGFEDLGKAFDRVLREAIRWAMHKLGTEEWLVSAVMSVYTGAKTVVRTVYGNSKCFEVNVVMLTSKDISLIVRGRLYSSCVRSSMLHGSETWPVRKEMRWHFSRQR